MTTLFSYLRLPVLASSAIAALASGLLYFKQNELIYPRNIPMGSRTEEGVPRPNHFGIEDYEDLRIPTPDGEMLSAYFIRAFSKGSTKNITILMFHGNAGNIGHRIPIAKVLQEHIGCNVLMLEYRGYGLSTGTPNEEGLLVDAQTGLDFIRQRNETQNGKIIVYGQSLGGAVAIQLVAKNQDAGDVLGLILENTFTSIRKLIPSAFPPAKYLAPLCHQYWPSEDTLPRITSIPVLFISGLKDEIVPPSHMRQLHSHRGGMLPDHFGIIGFDPTEMSHDEYVDLIKSCIDKSSQDMGEDLEKFCKRCTYICNNGDGDKPFVNLRQYMEKQGSNGHGQDRFFYMALPPKAYVTVSEQLKRNCYSENGISRIVVEKPFGRDVETFEELQKAMERHWSEDEIFRIDHYLGKEMVKNLFVLRFGNPMFGAGWNCNHVDNVQITMIEGGGTEGRGGYFDDVGIIRDIMQNHLLQLLALVTMERPGSFSAEDVCHEKVRVLRLIRPIDFENTIVGQYNKSSDGEKPGYKDDDTVPKESRCATLCATVAYIKSGRWNGVPFILKAGKALNESKTEIRIQFKDTTAAIFSDTKHNELIIRIQPNEGVHLMMNSKLPALDAQTVYTDLDLTYRGLDPDAHMPEAYESLILDALKGDYSQSVRKEELEASWKIFTPLLHYLDEHEEIIPEDYAYGSTGPAVLDKFISSYQYKV